VQWRSATGDSHSLRRIFWFKHAQRCHKGRPRIEGAGSPFVQDAVSRQTQAPPAPADRRSRQYFRRVYAWAQAQS
jgi:hypothetical protein